jgi:hypothetical protein
MTTNLQTSDSVRPARGGLIALYAVLTVIGTVLPYAVFIPYLAQHGLNLGEILAQATGSTVPLLLTIDIVLSSIVFWDFMWAESKRLNLRGWPLLIIPNLLVGLCCALPLFLLWREAKMHAATAEVTA